MDGQSAVVASPSLARAVGRNTIVQFVGKILSTILGFTTSVLILRYLHPAGNGSYTTVMAYLGFFSVVADLGLYLILIRDLNKPGADPEKVVGNLLALRWVSAFCILSAGAIAVWAFHFTTIEKVAVLIGTGSYLAVAATQLMVGIFQSKLAMIYVAVGELLGRIVLLVTTYLVIHFYGSLYSVVFAVVTSSIVNFIFVWWSARRYVRIRLHFDWPYWSSTLRDTLPIAISIVLNLIYFRADTIILRLYKGTYDVGLYGAAYKILEILNTFPIMFVGLLLPSLGSAFSRGDTERFRAIFQKGFDLLLVAIVPMLVVGWMLARPIIVLIGGQEYAPAAPVLRLLLIAVSALFLGSLSGHVVTIINRQRQMVWSYLSVAVIGLVLYLTLIPRFSLYGGATGTIVTESLTAIVGYILITRVLHFRLRVSAIPKILLAGVAMAATIFALRSVNVWLAAGVSVVVYVAMVFATKLLSPSLVRELVARKTETTNSLPGT